MFDIKQELKLAFGENKSAIVAATLILFISIILGYVFEPYLHAALNPVVEDLTQKVQSGVVKLTFRDIFLNNILIVFQMFIYGIFFCLNSITLSFNGFFVGYYVATAPDLFEVLILIVPHGIFEFSSCILACASGFVLFKFVYSIFKTFLKENDKKLVDRLLFSYDYNFDILKQSLLLLAISIILMVIAGIVEAYFTVPIANLILSFVG